MAKTWEACEITTVTAEFLARVFPVEESYLLTRLGWFFIAAEGDAWDWRVTSPRTFPSLWAFTEQLSFHQHMVQVQRKH